MAEDEVQFYNQKIWECRDYLVSENNFTVCLSFIRDKWGVSAVALQFSINNYTKRSFNSIRLAYQDIFVYLARCKPIVEDFEPIKTQIVENGSQKSFEVKTIKNRIKTTFLSRAEYKDVCVRFILSDKDTGLLDDEKVFVKYSDFLSLIRILIDFRDNYLAVSGSALLRVSVDQLLEEVHVVNTKLNSFCPDVTQRLNSLQIQNPMNFSATSSDPILETKDIDFNLDSIEIPSDSAFKDFGPNGLVCSECGEPQNNTTSGAVCKNGHGGADGITVEEWISSKIPNNELQSESDDFIAKNVESMTLDINIDSIATDVKPAPSIEKFDNDFFVAKVLDGDCKNLETILSASISSEIPILSIIKSIGFAIDLNEDEVIDILFPSVSKADLSLMFYANSRCIKHFLNRHLEKQMTLPPSATPMFVKVSNSKSMTRSLMIDLLVFFSFYSLLKSQLQQRVDNTVKNKSLITFVMKMLMSPFVFSYLDSSSSKEMIISEVINRYKMYLDTDVFKSVLDDIHNTFAGDISVSETSIRQVISNLLDAAMPSLDSFEISAIYDDLEKASILHLSKESIHHEFTIDQLKKILVLESCFCIKGQIDFSFIQDMTGDINFELVPDSILSQYGIEHRKFDSSNLMRIITEELKDSKYFQGAVDAVNELNVSYRDLKGKNIEWANFPDKVLIAFCLWDLQDDLKIQSSFKHFSDKIDSSSISREMALSMLGKINDRTEEDYSSGLKAGKVIN